MKDQAAQWQEQLAKIEQAIAAQEGLRGVLDDAEIEATLQSLQEKRQVLVAKGAVSGASAQGDHAQAVGEKGVLVNGDVGGDVLGAGAQKTVNPDPAQAAATRARKRYLQWMYQQCNVLPLAAMGGEKGLSDEVTLEKVYVDLDTKTRIELPHNEMATSSAPLGAERPLRAREAATQTKRLALLGGPGSGKSTFVRQLAARTAAAYLAEEPPFPDWEERLIPVLITLRKLAPELTVLDLQDISEAAQEEHLVETVRSFLTARLQTCKAEDWDTCLEDVCIRLSSSGDESSRTNMASTAGLISRVLAVIGPSRPHDGLDA